MTESETDVAPGEETAVEEASPDDTALDDPHAVHEKTHPKESEYIKIAIILGLITAAEVVTYYLDTSTAVLAALLIPMMVAKFVLVAMFFMHLRYDSKVFTSAFVFGIGLAVGVYFVALATFQIFGWQTDEMTRLLGAEVGFDAFGVRLHPEVWVLIAALVLLAVYAVRVVGPRAVPAGSPVVTRRQVTAFFLGLGLLWLAADWPIHDVGEEYLYSVHMVQHLLLTFAVPPLFLLATPTWLARLMVGDGWFGGKVLRVLVKPLVAGLVFNVAIVLTHWPALVDLAVESGPVHYQLHLMLVGASLLMWTPVCGPLPEYRLSAPAQMVYLFLMSVIPTVPAAWLTFADGVVYSAYDRPDRLFGINPTDDQQVAGLTMKLIGGGFLWAIIVYLFFRWASDEEKKDRASRRVVARTPVVKEPVPAEAADSADAEVLTWDQVEHELQHLGPGPPESHNSRQ